jgi:hypothetical protein
MSDYIMLFGAIVCFLAGIVEKENSYLLAAIYIMFLLFYKKNFFKGIASWGKLHATGIA